jgi:hypothetical protein
VSQKLDLFVKERGLDMTRIRYKTILFCILCYSASLGCSAVQRNLTASPLRIVVGPVTFEAPVTASKQIHTFEESPDSEQDRMLLPMLINDIEVNAQRMFTEQWAKQPGVDVVPFDEVRRALADIAPSGMPLTEAQIQALGQQTRADHVVTGLIHDYGAVRWQYWVAGWLAHASVGTTIVGLASAWNPAALGAYLAFDFTTDLPIWYGGAQMFGWALRPVRIHLDLVQVTGCPGLIWSRDELVVRVPGKALAEYPEDQRRLKEVQLEANLKRAVEDITEQAHGKLSLQSCTADNKAQSIHDFSWASIFDLLL